MRFYVRDLLTRMKRKVLRLFLLLQGLIPVKGFWLWRSKEEVIQVDSVWFIQSIASGDEMVVREGGIWAFYGFVDQLLYYVRNREVSILDLALKAAFRLVKVHR
ncbi:hypothetical protein RJT34_24590 [Clitoria ternatea]|uniref:Uncharacterized protein n=1 Tax=Clitoria ternatea TaxID=43366 RepID=A0AAN9FN61_CLITE